MQRRRPIDEDADLARLLPPGYPWAREIEALAALERLEMARCRDALRCLALELEVPEGAPAGVAALLVHDLLGRVRRAIDPQASAAGPRERLRRAGRLGAAADLAALRAAIVQEVEALFASLADGADLSPSVLRARAFLDRSFSRRVTLRELAQAVHLSPNYLSSRFRRETGMTVTAYVRSRRVRLAEQLLLEGKHTISEVAYRVGYQNYRDFHRNFVRAGGRSPRAFQRLCRAGRRPLGAAPA